ncbi:MAG: oligosaccharide flippase family protein [Gammaproteobacteria bacterium]|nr:oligosaccharide flippase family protein [Gammaproteobacteria bacterium]
MTRPTSSNGISRYIRGSSLFRTAFGSFSLKVIAGGATFVSGILLARLLGPKEFGIYAIVMAAVTLAGSVAALGLPMLITREVARYQANEQWALLKGVMLTTHRWTLTAAAIFVSIGLLMVMADWPIADVSWSLAAPALIIIPLLALTLVRAASLRGLHWVILADIPDLMLRPILLLIIAGLVYMLVGSATAAEAMQLQAVCFAVAFVIGLVFLLKKTPAAVKSVAADHHHAHWIREAQPFFWIAVVFLVDSQVGLYLLGLLAGPEQAGIMQVALQLVTLVVIGLAAVNSPLQPRLSAALARQKTDEAQKLLTEAARLGTGVATVAALVLIPFAPQIVALFGPEYQEAANVLRIVVLGQLINAMAGSCGITLNAGGYQSITLLGVIVALIVNSILCWLLIPHWQALGAAVALSASLLVWNVMLAVAARRKLGLYTPIRFS